MSPLPRKVEKLAPPLDPNIFKNKESQKDRPPVTPGDAIKIILARMKKGETTLTQSILEDELDISAKKASELMKEMEKEGIISAYERCKPRNILITQEVPPVVVEPSPEPIAATAEPTPVEAVKTTTTFIIPRRRSSAALGPTEPIVVEAPEPEVTIATPAIEPTEPNESLDPFRQPEKKYTYTPSETVPKREGVLNIATLLTPEERGVKVSQAEIEALLAAHEPEELVQPETETPRAAGRF